MIRFILRWAINAVALYAAVVVVNNTIGGLGMENLHWTAYIWLGLIFGFVNAILRPVIKLLTCPLILLTLGLFTLIINTFLFYLVGWIGSLFGVGYQVENFWAAFVGAIVVSIVSYGLSLILKDELRESKRPKPKQ